MTAPTMVGRITDETQLPGGAVLLMKRAREAAGWFTWATGGRYEKRDGSRVPRLLVKGRHPDGRRFVVCYVEGKVHTVYTLAPPDHAVLAVSVARLRAFIDGDGVPSDTRT